MAGQGSGRRALARERRRLPRRARAHPGHPALAGAGRAIVDRSRDGGGRQRRVGSGVRPDRPRSSSLHRGVVGRPLRLLATPRQHVRPRRGRAVDAGTLRAGRSRGADRPAHRHPHDHCTHAGRRGRGRAPGSGRPDQGKGRPGARRRPRRPRGRDRATAVGRPARTTAPADAVGSAARDHDASP